MNAAVTLWEPVGASGSYPEWIRGLRGQNGVYAIRDIRDGTILYVGESSSHRLYETLTRHFQRWTDKYDTAGPTFDRHMVEVAVVVVPSKGAARPLQDALICALEPQENRLDCEQILDRAELDEAHGMYRQIAELFGIDVDAIVNLLVPIDLPF